MGSPKVSKAKPQLPMENKPVKNPFFASIKKFFKGKKKDKVNYEKDVKVKEDRTKPNCVKNENRKENEDTVAKILKTFENLDIKAPSKEEQTKNRKNSTEEAELTNFNFKVIEDDRKRHSSEDSGYSETKEEYSKEDQEVIDSFNKLKIEEQEKEEAKKDKDNKKKLKEVFASRTPIRSNKVGGYNVEPYPARQVNHQINQQALCGGQVFVASGPDFERTTTSELDQALNDFKQVSQASNQSDYLDDVLQVIVEDSQISEDYIANLLQRENPDDLLRVFGELIDQDQNVTINVVPNVEPAPNPTEELYAAQNLPNSEVSIDLNNPLFSFGNVPDNTTGYIFPTPPRSETVPSPMSESQASLYPPTWDFSRSPGRSSPLGLSDNERCQEIFPSDPLSPVSEVDERKGKISVCSLTRTNSMSSMTLKNFKDLQKEIGNEFSKKDCCQVNRKTLQELFDEHMGKLTQVERKNLCFNVAKMELKTAYGVLQHVILSAASGREQMDLLHALFVLVCQRLLAQSPALFYGDFGLSILKSAVMRCPHHPLLTRFFVHYIYAALRQETTAAAQECIFHEVDVLGDNLIIACARGGDAFALVLAEITRVEVRAGLPPLFRVHHANADGYTALHVSCSLHSARSPRLHTLHVLLEHAQADIWKGDVKGGDTALHLAVNSANCDLRVIMMIFKQVDRKMWKKLAHCQNMSSVTPLEYARSATKSTTRQNYPQEVLDFLKKCR